MTFTMIAISWFDIFMICSISFTSFVKGSGSGKATTPGVLFQGFHALCVVLVVLQRFLLLTLLALVLVHDGLDSRDGERDDHEAEAADQDVAEKG